MIEIVSYRWRSVTLIQRLTDFGRDMPKGSGPTARTEFGNESSEVKLISQSIVVRRIERLVQSWLDLQSATQYGSVCQINLGCG